MLNHAFLIMTHKSPELLSRIIHHLAQDNHYFFIHVDKRYKGDIRDFADIISDVKNVIFIPRQSVYHGSVTQIYCEIALFANALNYHERMDYFHLISGQDYPIRSNVCFDLFFEKNNGRSFACIEGKDYHEEMMKRSYLIRTQIYHPNTNSLISSLFFRLTWRLQLQLNLRKPIRDIWGGWNWKSLTRYVVKFMLEYINENPAFLRRFNYTLSCDEIYFQTIFHKRMQEFKIEGLLPLRYVSWEATHPVNDNYRPYILDERDLPFILSSQAFFCRKVDLPQSKMLLDLIDQNRDNDFIFENANPILKLKSYN